MIIIYFQKNNGNTTGVCTSHYVKKTEDKYLSITSFVTIIHYVVT